MSKNGNNNNKPKQPSKTPPHVTPAVFTTPEGDLKLIETVKAFVVIYDPRQLGYKDPRIKENTWKKIGHIVGASGPDCRCRWRSLRDRFVREKKAMLLNASRNPNKEIKKWKLLDSMTFLWEFIMHRSRNGAQNALTVVTDEQLLQIEGEQGKEYDDSGAMMDRHESQQGFEWISMGAEEDDMEPEEVEIEEEEVSDHEQEVEMVQEAHVQQPPRKRPWRDEGSPPLGMSMVSSSAACTSVPVIRSSISSGPVNSSSSPTGEHDFEHEDALEDEDSLFCKSIAHTLRRLPSRRKALAKLRILQAVYDAEFGRDVGLDVEVSLK